MMIAKGSDGMGASDTGMGETPTITVAALAKSLDAVFLERSEAIRAMLLAVLAKEHVVLVGPPGVAKSALARALAAAFGASYFEYLLTRFTEPSEIFGPVDPNAFRAGRYARQTAGKMPEAIIAFLDEVFKGNSAILNSQLGILNERQFDAGSGPCKVPLHTCIGASNELPESEELSALYDRFMIRLYVDRIAERSNFRRFLEARLTRAPLTIPGRVDIRAESEATRKVLVTPETLDAMTELAWSCRSSGFAPSDRRWGQSLGIVQAAAHIDGRVATEPEDLECLENVLWNKPDERAAVARLIQTVVNPAGARAVEELDAAREILAKLPARESTDAGAYMGAIGGAVRDVGEIMKRLESFPSGRKVDAARKEVTEIKAQVAKLAMRAAGVEL